ncbi:MAG: RNA-protein complex protein Nop10 [Methanomicrobiales archaeon]|nr:RNA-protein complex protein Nop10 [Methanomicrobiales archaeon]
MRAYIRRCPYDGTYTLHPICPLCGSATRLAHPPRYSPQDRFWRYRGVRLSTISP